MDRQLNDAQLEAIHHDKGPALVLAGPGSGKTTVIAQRIKYLIAERNVQPQHILVITFTRAAAEEMKLRFFSLMGKKGIAVQFGTFHAIFFAILRHAYHYTAHNIVKEDIRQNIVRDLLRRLPDEEAEQYENDADVFMELLQEISLVKSERIELEHYFAKSCGHETFRKIYKGYNEALQRQRLLDFDDMQLYCYELFVARPDILKQWQSLYTYILIDEFQDINPLQYDIIKMIAKPEDNLFVVGDDDQSIYRFRGASPEIMLGFSGEYPQAKKILLSKNYRCPPKVVEISQKVIVHNERRYAKKLEAVSQRGEDEVRIDCYETATKQNESIALQIQKYHEKGIPYSHMGALFRTNVQTGALAAKLMEKGIPFVAKEFVPDLYRHWVARDVMAYLRIAKGSRERGLFLQIINRPVRYISRDALGGRQVDLEELLEYYEDKEWMAERVERLQYDLVTMGSLRPFAAINYLRKGVGYEAFLHEYAREHRMKKEELLEVLDEVQEQSKACKTLEDWFSYIEEYQKNIQQQSKKDDKQLQEGVLLGTMHGAKGLEYDVVFIPDVNEERIPHSRAMLEQDIEEERRMLYVAMTRAKKHLHISYVKERYNKEVDMSRFLEDLIL